MPNLAPLPMSLDLVSKARDQLGVLVSRETLQIDPAVAGELAEVIGLLNAAIGGPIDPNAPAAP